MAISMMVSTVTSRSILSSARLQFGTLTTAAYLAMSPPCCITNWSTATPSHPSCSDDEAPEESVPPLIPEAQREEVKHSFQGKEEVSSSTTAMLPRLLNIGVKPGDSQEEQASHPATEAESSNPAARQRKKDKGKSQDDGTSRKRRHETGASPTAGSHSTPVSAFEFWNPSCQLGSSAIASPTTIYLGISRPASPWRRPRCCSGMLLSYRRMGSVVYCKRSDNLKKAQKKATVLEGELRRKIDELQHAAYGPVYRHVHDRKRIKDDDFYVRDTAKDQVEAFHKGWLVCLKELNTPPLTFDAEDAAKVETEKESEKEADRVEGGSLDNPHICEVPCIIIKKFVT
ncbi:hypothetical protein Acr_17g0006820 [Actinidia rufa]|uniref:Uncharacterized protein n=1 Tax=Actinidia rufa TaxID=165716 RepID=A0A7J0G2V2_9ERIC|nr:hypothetical protein Acr_17g0006820 [Actinidia rufa]